MSIFSLCKESRRFASIHKADVVLCTYPCHPTYGKNDLFDNDETVASFHDLIKQYAGLESLTLHVPELALDILYGGLARHEDYLAKIPDLHINIMNQNIKYMPDETTVANLYRYTANITQTTAHDRYATQEMCNKYGMPLHHMSVFIDSSSYEKTDYTNKSNVIVYSPDKKTDFRDPILSELRSKLHGYRLVEVRDMSYSKYKKVVADAKFVLTFGEGFDGYFIESVFSGGVPFAAYNDEFFPAEDFKKYPSVYKNYEEMLKNICGDVAKFDSKKTYEELNAGLYDRLSQIYSFKNYINNLENFYRGKYTFLPETNSVRKFFAKVVTKKNDEIAKLNNLVTRHEEAEKNALEAARHQLEVLDSVRNSKSWKLTKPLRQFSWFASRSLRLWRS